jgi:hypothetical protein
MRLEHRCLEHRCNMPRTPVSSAGSIKIHSDLTKGTGVLYQRPRVGADRAHAIRQAARLLWSGGLSTRIWDPGRSLIAPGQSCVL